MTLFTIVIFLHLLGALALFIGYGIEWAASSLFRSASSVEQARAWLRMFMFSPALAGVGLGVLILSGGYLASLSGAMKQGWIPASLLGVAIALLIGFIVILPRMRGIRKVLPAQDAAVSAELRVRLADPLLLTAIRVRVMLALAIVYLMVAKTRFLPSLVALLVAMLLGLLFSIPIWRRPA